MITLNGNFDNAVEDGTELVLKLKTGASAVDNMSPTGTTITVFTNFVNQTCWGIRYDYRFWIS